MAPPMALANLSSIVQVHIPTASTSTALLGEATAIPSLQRNGTTKPNHRQRKKAFAVLIPLAVLTVLGIAGIETIEHFSEHTKTNDTKASNTTNSAMTENELRARKSAPPTPLTPLNVAFVSTTAIVGSLSTAAGIFGLSKLPVFEKAIKKGKKEHEQEGIDKKEKTDREEWNKEHPHNNKRDQSLHSEDRDFLPFLFDLGYLSSTGEHNALSGQLGFNLGNNGYLDIVAEETGTHFNGTVSKIHHTTEDGIAVGNLTVNLPGGNETSRAGHWYSVNPEEVGPKSINAFAELFANKTSDDNTDFDITVNVDALAHHFSLLFGH